MKKISISKIILGFVSVLVLLMMIFPIYVMAISSFKELSEIFKMDLFPHPSTLSFDNYREVFVEANLGRNISNTAYISVIVTLVALVTHAMSAYAMARLRFPGKKPIFTMVISTLMIPFAVIMIPLFIIVKNMSLINSLWGVILTMIPNAYGIFLYHQYFLGVPAELEEAARIDGASIFGTFTRIVMPLAGPVTIMLGVSFFVANWNNYLWPMIVLQDREKWVLQVAIASFRSEHTVSWNLVMAASVVASIPTIILFFLFQRYITDGIKTSGIKA